MTKLFAIIMCIVFTLGIVVVSVGKINYAIVKPSGLQDRTISWIENSVPNPSN
ncbi:hypothetical protein ACQCN2_21115 [Brevibacillus ginsengisoli]|uniref:hypothetical protein n=1 Tax=Brevibacillus ginsengisoli TaxID=363854 RepID=UPI003CF0B0D0